MNGWMAWLLIFGFFVNMVFCFLLLRSIMRVDEKVEQLRQIHPESLSVKRR